MSGTPQPPADAGAGPSRDPAASLSTYSASSAGSVLGGEDDHGNLTRPEVNQGVLQVAGHGLLKRVSLKAVAKESNKAELDAYRAFAGTPLRHFAPQLIGSPTEDDGSIHLHLEDLTSGFASPCVADMKMGIRTFVESEVSNAKKRPDLAGKMVAAEPGSLDAAEQAEGITKLRYMQFRDALSSSATLGWRVDGLHVPNGRLPVSKSLRSSPELLAKLSAFTQARVDVARAIGGKLVELREALRGSTWFARHELIGSSLMIIYDDESPPKRPPSVWMIDFAKTTPLPEGMDDLDHRKAWVEGNHEDGYLKGLDSLIGFFAQLEPPAAEAGPDLPPPPGT